MASASKFLFAVRPPTVLSMPGFGVDISGGSIKCIEFGGTSAARVLKTHVEMPIDAGVIVDGDIEIPDKLVDVLRTVRLKHGVRNVHASLPEKKAFIYQTIVPPGRAPQDAIAFDLEAHVPLPPEEIAYDFDFVREEKEGRIYTVTA
ncbi:MAG: pilus assembly protein PilM, partial [Patescibacteria group bacterium]